MSLVYTHDDWQHDTNVSGSVTIPAGALILVSCPMFSGGASAPAVPTGSGLTFTEIGHSYSGLTGTAAWTAVAPGGGFSGAISADAAMCFDIAVDHFVGATGSIVQSLFSAVLMDPGNVEFDSDYPSGAITAGNMGLSFWYNSSGAFTSSARSGWAQQMDQPVAGRVDSIYTTTATDTAAGITYSVGGSHNIRFFQLEVQASAGAAAIIDDDPGTVIHRLMNPPKWPESITTLFG